MSLRLRSSPAGPDRLAVAVALSDNGYAVALTARSRAESTARRLRRATLVHEGITDATFVDDLFGAVEEQLGAVDVLVANAGAALRHRSCTTE
jgi:NADP-dependent 3-hydroxy acid dehydrogenase YdfG